MWIWSKIMRVSWVEHRTKSRDTNTDGGIKKISDRNNPKLTEEIVGTQNEMELSSRKHNP